MKKSKWISMLVMIIASLSFAGKVWANTEQSIWQLEKTTNLVQHYLYDKNDNRASKVVDGTSLFWLKNNEHEIGGYCIDLNVPAKINADYKAEDLEDLKTETEKQYKNNEDKIRTIITSSYPSLTLETLKKNSKIEGLTKNEAVRATQLLIWKILHNGTYQKEETIRTYEAKLFDDKKFTGSEDIDVIYHHVISINDNGYQRRFPMSAADITTKEIGASQSKWEFWPFSKQYYLSESQIKEVNKLHKESAERVYKLYQYLDEQTVEANPREEISVKINGLKVTADHKVSADFSTIGNDLMVKARLFVDGKFKEEKNLTGANVETVEFEDTVVNDGDRIIVKLEASQKITKINSLISANPKVVTQTIIGVEPIVTYNTVIDEKEIKVTEKPRYEEGTLQTTVKVDEVTGSKTQAATIEIGEDTITKDVIDTVAYSNLQVGEQYTLTGTLMKIVDGSEPVAVKTSEVVTFTAEENNGTVEVTFKDVELKAGHKYVVYEKAESVKEYTYQEDGKEVTKKHQAIHENPKDKAQTIVVNQTDIETGHSEIIETDENTVPDESGSYDDRTVIETEEDTWKPTYKKGTLATTVNVGDATGSKNQAATIEISEDTFITNVTDTINYKDLFAGVEYKVTGKLMDITNINNPVEVATATATFTPQVATGTTSITFKGVTLTAKHKYVVYEYAESTTNMEFVDGNKPHKAEHTDPSDKAQTIVVNQTNIEIGHSEIIETDENTAPGESGSYEDKTVIETEEGNSTIIDIDENTAPGESGSYEDKTVIETEEGNSTIIDIDENTAPGESGSYEDKTVIETEEGNSTIIDIDENTALGESGSYEDKTVIETEEGNSTIIDIDENTASGESGSYEDKTEIETEEDTWKPSYQTGNLSTTVKVDNVIGTSDQVATIEISEDAVTKDIIDIVKYANLKSGEQYTITGRLMKVIEGKEPQEVAISEPIIFTAKENDGTIEVPFKNVKLEANAKYVVFEKAISINKFEYAEGTKHHEATHADLNDKAQTIVVKQKENKHIISISKVDIHGKELEGAQIELYNEKGEKIDSWESTKDVHQVTLASGTYIFKEKYAPKGFEVVTDITFKVDENGKVIVENSQATVNKEGVLVVVDDYSKPETPVTRTKVEKSVISNLPKTGSKSMLFTTMFACISGLFGVIILKNNK